jgi:hypothetical protein
MPPLGKCRAFASSSVLLTLVAVLLPAQPTTNILSRILMVESQYGRGTIFSIDVDQREYWITAKHILNGRQHPPYGAIMSKSVSLRILNPGAEGEQWLPETFSVIDPGEDIDIVVLAAGKPLLSDPLQTLATGADGLYLGQDCEFLGFPHGGGWRGKFGGDRSIWAPFVKHCTLSAMALDSKRIWILDGINNEGLQQKIFGVISGYYAEPAEVVPYDSGKLTPENMHHQEPASQPDNSAHTREKVDVNSGFILAFDISYATDGIKKNPIGPLRTAK